MPKRLTSIGFKQYKRFPKDETLEIRPITLLIGKNSSGKSSLMKLVASGLKGLSGEQKSLGLPLEISEGVNLGMAYSSICRNGNNVGLEFAYVFGDDLKFEYSFIASKKNEPQLLQMTVKAGGSEHAVRLAEDKESYIWGREDKRVERDEFAGLFPSFIFAEDGKPEIETKFDYIGPLRAEPRRVIFAGSREVEKSVGPKGENAYQILCKLDDISQKVSEWFVEHLNGSEMRVRYNPDDASYRIELHKPENGDFWVNIADEGMGYSQILPIVTRAIYKVENSVVLIEQPELHLHPAAHACVAELLAKTAKENKHTYIVESHSENFLLGLRNAVVSNEIDLSPEDVMIYFVDDLGDSFEEGATLRPITIDADGALSDWPTGVFNESFDLLMELKRKAARNRNKS